MEKFELTYEVKNEDDIFKIRVYPINAELQNKLESWLNIIEFNQITIDEFVLNQTDNLFNELQNSDFINKTNYFI